jgi:hypothetical protein
MKKQLFLILFLLLTHPSISQNIESSNTSEQVTKLFRNQEMLQVKLGFSNKDIKKKTNDSTYISTEISYLADDEMWKTFEVELRVRGYFRKKTCYFPPIKIRISKSAGKNTLFEGNKKLKLVLPCSTQKSKNDYIVKEYMAYKLYEIISPYHFNTRITSIAFIETKGSKIKTHDLKGIFIEDDKKIAKRYGGKILDRSINPMSQDPISSVRNAFFQFMIGNNDFSTYAPHNEKLMAIDQKIVPIPYDFDLSGLVNASYAVVSVINDEPLTSSVTERLYRGFKRDLNIIQQVRQEFIDNKTKLLEIVDSTEPFFENPKALSEAKKFLSDFFDIMEDDGRFNKEIIENLRTK